MLSVNHITQGHPTPHGEGKAVPAGQAGVRIVFYSPQTLPSIGGLQYVVHFWAEALTKKGHQVTVISETPESAHQPISPSNHHPVKSSTQQLVNQSTSPPIYTILRNVPFLQQVAAMRAADKIIMFNVSLKGMPAWLLSGKALYLSHHTALWYEKGSRPWQQRLKLWVANHLAKKNCACSGYIASLYQSCEIIYSPYRSDVFVPGTLPRIPGSILFAGRLVSDKGADLLIEAFAILINTPLHTHSQTGSPFQGELKGRSHTQTNSDLQVELVGPSLPSHSPIDLLPYSLTIIGDGPDRAHLEEKVKHLGLSQRIIFKGALPQSELVHLLQTHEVMVVPSRMEPMGMVVAEGLACGCKMVVSNQGGMPEVGGRFCHYFESGNAKALVVALTTALTKPLPINDQNLDAHLQQFTIDHSVDRLENWLGV